VTRWTKSALIRPFKMATRAFRIQNTIFGSHSVDRQRSDGSYRPFFFADYPSFNYNRSASSPQEFYRMCDHFHWVKDGRGQYPQGRISAHEAFRLAMVETFNHNFGTNVDDKKSWESICYLLRIKLLPGDIAEMKKVCIVSIFRWT
jgi:hypothetical protein